MNPSLSYYLYKLFNALFLGLSTGSIFILYQPLEPSIYSIGGLLLAVGMMGVALLYRRLFNLKSYYLIAAAVELVILVAMLYFLQRGYGYYSALVLYSSYQISFLFGGYLPRAETLLIPTESILSKLDTIKQLGYLMGMGGSYLFYKLLASQLIEKKLQVYYLHYLLVIIELLVLGFLIASYPQTKEPSKR